MLILILFVILFIASGCIGYYLWNKNLIPIEKYTGAYKERILKAKQYLLDNYPGKKFDISIAVNHDKRITGLTYDIFGTPKILLNEDEIINEGWLKDFNLIAEIIKSTYLMTIEDLTIFLLFHEFRHILQDRKIAVMTPVDTDERVKRVVTAYHQQPREWDADVFGLKNVQIFKSSL